MAGKILVIAVGNPIRQDDAVGPYCLELLRERYGAKKTLVDFMVAHQLDVLHCEVFARYSLIILVDAEGRPIETSYSLEQLGADPTLHSFNSHIGCIGDILALTERLYGSTPKAYLVAIKGLNFEVGEELSTEALSNAHEALAAIEQLIDEFFPPQ